MPTSYTLGAHLLYTLRCVVRCLASGVWSVPCARYPRLYCPTVPTARLRGGGTAQRRTNTYISCDKPNSEEKFPARKLHYPLSRYTAGRYTCTLLQRWAVQLPTDRFQHRARHESHAYCPICTPCSCAHPDPRLSGQPPHFSDTHVVLLAGQAVNSRDHAASG